ncbi:S-Ena type endospore appendage [Bacillus sp. 165]|uniref:S-Ena type endospore appendage n=1 Tax=Bacillus sp. 165 TaxID=1529117 RepID=UPI001ADA898C|nr:S-Ena type endospore appendage [Bacillus sp. 165]MBO9128087.1 hypothetical protein [Bacillus sp. 165]
MCSGDKCGYNRCRTRPMWYAGEDKCDKHHKKHECDCCEIQVKVCKCDEEPKCDKPIEVKGLNLCHKKEVKCFKHCSPISQPCNCQFFNHFTSRADIEFSGLIVVKNTGIAACGCYMLVRVTDSKGESVVATVTPESSVPIFVDCLTSLDISCFKHADKSPCTTTCKGEIIFDLEYWAVQCITDHRHGHDEC